MDVSGKTPISFLQEICVKKGLTPEYDLIHSVPSVHTSFTYELTCGHYKTTGSGSSKKEAKHNAAANMLHFLNDIPEYASFEINKYFKLLGTSISQNPAYEVSVRGNAVGALEELCENYAIPSPIYEYVREEGPAHSKQFTVRCCVYNIVEDSSASTKKQAKQLVSSEMVDRLKSIISENRLITRNVNYKAEDFLDCSAELTELVRVKLSMTATNLHEAPFNSYAYPETLLSLVSSEDIKKTDFLNDQDPLELLKKITSDLKIGYRIQVFSEINDETVVMVTLECVPELTSAGFGATVSEAKCDGCRNAILSVCKYFDEYLKTHEFIAPVVVVEEEG